MLAKPSNRAAFFPDRNIDMPHKLGWALDDRQKVWFPLKLDKYKSVDLQSKESNLSEIYIVSDTSLHAFAVCTFSVSLIFLGVGTIPPPRIPMGAWC